MPLLYKVLSLKQTKNDKHMATEHKGVRINTDLIDKIKTQAQKERRTFSNMVNLILEKYFDKAKAPQKD